jgi:hypothetical protein
LNFNHHDTAPNTYFLDGAEQWLWSVLSCPVDFRRADMHTTLIVGSCLSFWGEWSLSSTITRLDIIDRELFITHLSTASHFSHSRSDIQ